MKQLNSFKIQWSFTSWILSLIIFIFSTIVIIGYALDTANVLNFARLSIAIIFVILAILIYFLKFRPKFERNEIIQCLLIFVAFFFIGIKPILPSLYPINHSVDFVHHYSLLNYIYEHQTLVKQAEGNLGEMYRYPFGIDLIQAYLSWVTGIDTLRIGHIFMSLVFALSMLTFYGILNKMFYNKDNGNIIAFCCPFLLLFLKDYTLNEYWRSYHSSQMFGTLIVLASILILSEIEYSIFNEIALVLGGLVLLLSFPLWMAILDFIVVFCYLLNGKTVLNKIHYIAYFLIPQFIIFITYFKQGYVLSSIGISTNNGETTKPNISTFGGYIFIALFMIGIILLLKNVKLKELDSIRLVFNLASIALILQFVGLKILTRFGFGSEYIVLKTFFLAKYFYVAIIAYTILEISKYIKINHFSKKMQYFVASILLLIALCLSILFLIPKTTPLINQGEYKLSLGVKDSEIKSNMMLFPYPESGVTSYLIYTGIWKQDRIKNPSSYNYLFNRNIPNIMGWINGGGKEEYALIGDIKKQLNATNLLKYVSIVKKDGDSAIVKRNNKQNFIKISDDSFESGSNEWQKVSYNKKDFEMNVDSAKYFDGNNSLTITANSINGGMAHKIKVDKDTLYKITAYCSGKDVKKENGYGTFMSIEGFQNDIVEWSQGTYDWQKKELIFNSGDKTEVNLVLGLGAYGSASGQVWFDNIEIYKADVTH